ncbi:MAG: hypothetical protein MSS16_07815 [Streptococcus orisratti]|uniref:hypothetical protein n=1 Tax=Streptococcus orisratti TaxID=114652 RepID=UPI0023545B6F|nr:hypothetical protein [Streptococcus orisratti]MCI7677968.1 hypothetical protein [Streptococcus orisratti]
MKKNPTRDNLKNAKKSVKKVKVKKTKTLLKKRIAKVEQAILITEAKTAVDYLEKNQDRSNIKEAQDKVTALKSKTLQSELNKRIDAVSRAISAEEEAIAAAETAIKNLENSQIRDNIADAQIKTDAVTSTTVKDGFTKRIDAVVQAIETRETENAAEAAVKNLENNQVRENIADAQNKVNAVTDTTKKDAFNTRITAVTNAIDTREAQAAAAAQQAATQAQQQNTGGYKRDSRGRWHRANGQYASKAEIAAAGLPW